MSVKRYRCFIPLFVVAITITAAAQIRDWPDDAREGIKVNYTEAHVGAYTLPDPLALPGGGKVPDIRTWTEKRRPEIVRLFEDKHLKPAAKASFPS